MDFKANSLFKNVLKAYSELLKMSQPFQNSFYKLFGNFSFKQVNGDVNIDTKFTLNEVIHDKDAFYFYFTEVK